ncbi:hypothetical protein E2C01_048849 [Portunus trituberculatus]|uniref:Uncharacterized protein n=1 Tax=Portunus trituberculatus TaxID=210409 RepID=A0A5B7G456_PORTR|nr:hypothetical protein [Portunus trituberculatus]
MTLLLEVREILLLCVSKAKQQYKSEFKSLVTELIGRNGLTKQEEHRVFEREASSSSPPPSRQRGRKALTHTRSKITDERLCEWLLVSLILTEDQEQEEEEKKKRDDTENEQEAAEEEKDDEERRTETPQEGK